MNFSKSFFSKYRVFLRKIERKTFHSITIRPTLKPKKWVLVSYVMHPFTVKRDELAKSPHTNPWECLEIVDILLERGFGVDVIEWTDIEYVPKREYIMIIDVYRNLERLAPYLPKNCLKIFYITGGHFKYHNAAEAKRLDDLKNRRGTSLLPRRKIEPAENIIYADYATSLGNNFAKSTYAFSGKKIVQIPLFSNVLFPVPKKDFIGVKQNFVWIGGGGAVHKGLDLVLETFAKLPEYKLTVCGPVEGEKDFFDFYKKELCETENIKFVGRINVRGNQFKAIVENSIGLVYPSCSEGQSGSVITGLHAGLIPIVTHESGVDVESFGIELEKASIEEITRAIKNIANMSESTLQEKSTEAWKYAQTHNTREIFRKDYASFIDGIIQDRKLNE